MELKYDATAYICKQGNAYHKLKLFLTLGYQSKEIDGLLNEIKSLQNLDGSWPWRFRRRNPGGVIETTNTTEMLLKLGAGEVMQSMSFIQSIQRDDGGWSENPQLTSHIPKEWVFWRTDCSSPFFTGEALSVLVASGHKDNPSSKRGFDYLVKTQNEAGGWPLNSDPRYAKTDEICTYSAIRAFTALGHDRNSPILQRALDAVKSHFDIWMKALYNASEPWAATAMLESLLILDPKNTRLVELEDYLVSIQRPDGGWGWKENPSDPEQTLRCIKILMKQ